MTLRERGMLRRILVCLGLSCVLWGCSQPSLQPPQSTPSQAYSSKSLSESKRHDVVIQAMAMLDRGYTYGGKKLHTGFDCSGLVSFVYAESAGIAIKGSAADMAQVTRPIRPEHASPGDLVFFNTLGSSFSHVGIYIGSGKFIHAANEKTGVKVERLSSPYWAQRFQGYRSLGV